MMRMPDIVELRERRWNALREMEKARAADDRWRRRFGRLFAAARRVLASGRRSPQAQAALGEAPRAKGEAIPPEGNCMQVGREVTVGRTGV